MSENNENTSEREAIDALLSRIPESQRPAAVVLVAQYGPRLLAMAVEDAWSYIRRLMAGDLEAAAELDDLLSDDEFVAKVKTNTARWADVEGYNIARAKIRNEVALRLAPILLSILFSRVFL